MPNRAPRGRRGSPVRIAERARRGCEARRRRRHRRPRCSVAATTSPPAKNLPHRCLGRREQAREARQARQARQSRQAREPALRASCRRRRRTWMSGKRGLPISRPRGSCRLGDTSARVTAAALPVRSRHVLGEASLHEVASERDRPGRCTNQRDDGDALHDERCSGRDRRASTRSRNTCRSGNAQAPPALAAPRELPAPRLPSLIPAAPTELTPLPLSSREPLHRPRRPRGRETPRGAARPRQARVPARRAAWRSP